MYETMFSPVCLGGVELKNRIIFAPASMGLKDEEYKEKIRKIFRLADDEKPSPKNIVPMIIYYLEK